MSFALDHSTKITVALALVLAGAVGSFLVVQQKVEDVRTTQQAQGEKIDRVQQDVAFIKGRLELMSSVSKSN